MVGSRIRFVIENTIEERIVELREEKEKKAHALQKSKELKEKGLEYNSDEEGSETLTLEELRINFQKSMHSRRILLLIVYAYIFAFTSYCISQGC